MEELSKTRRTAHLQLICIRPPERPTPDEPAVCGLQDRHQQVFPGQLQADGSLLYEADIEIYCDDKRQAVRLRGPFVQGPSSAPFLYLSWRRLGIEPASWIRRLKIPLPTLNWEQIVDLPGELCMNARIEGKGSGTVPLLDGGWKFQTS